MELKLTNEQVDKLQKKLGRKYSVNFGFSTSDRADGERSITIEGTSSETLFAVRAALKDLDIPTSALSRFINALADPYTKSIPSLEAAPDIFRAFFKAAVEKSEHARYLVRDEGPVGQTYLPIEIEFVEGGRREANSVTRLTVTYIDGQGVQESQFTIHKNQVGKTVMEILNSWGLGLMTSEYEERYNGHLAKYAKLRSMHKHQLLVKGTGFEINRRSWFWAPDVDLSPSGTPTRAVIDWTLAGKNKHQTVETSLTGETVIPLHPQIPVFSLSLHQNYFVSVGNVKPYKYDERIQEKLVLPDSHRRLISALCTDLELLRGGDDEEDDGRSAIIQNKAKTNLILAYGPPGTGKTLTAEVYAEVMKRPLYEVASGQLGAYAEEIAKSLDEILARSLNLDMPLLINEADVFVRERGDDMAQNAVCATFLMKLEYHPGIVFITTNRSVDDAIASRCIAEIKYGVPAEAERRKLWQILGREFGVEFKNQQLDALVHMFPTTVGRDIQNLMRLTTRVAAAAGVPFSIKLLAENAVFKSIQTVPYPEEKS